MYCCKCNNDLSQCTCPDIHERLKSATEGGHFAYKKCNVCGKHYKLCRCESPQFGVEFKETNQ